LCIFSIFKTKQYAFHNGSEVEDQSEHYVWMVTSMVQGSNPTPGQIIFDFVRVISAYVLRLLLVSGKDGKNYGIHSW